MNARSLTVSASPSPRRRRVLLAAFAGLALACATGLAGPAQALAAPCPNEALRAEARSTLLPQCRAYELVSPVYTADSGLSVLHGVPPFKGAAPDGEAAEFLSVGAFAGAGSDYAWDTYIARREKVGWATSWVGVPATLGGTQLTTVLSSDLTKELLQVQFLTGEKAGSPGLLLSENLASAPAFSFTEVPEYTKIPEYEHGGITGPIDESPDFSHVVVRGPNVLGAGHSEYELYELAGVGGPETVLRPITVDPTTGHEIPGTLGRGEGPGGSVFHAISNDGAEIFFTNHESAVSYVRVNGSKTLELGGGLFQGASEDGSKVFLSGAAAGELYMDEIGSKPGHEEVTKTVPISGASFGFYLRSSDDGSHVYFLSTGVLSGANVEGHSPEENQFNLYVYEPDPEHPGQYRTVFIAQALPGFSNTGDVEAQVNGCPSEELKEPEEPGCEAGRFFVFTSTEHITPDDTSSAPQVFEYDAKTGRLVRVSTGENGYANNGNDSALGATIAAPAYGEIYEEAEAQQFETNTRAVSDNGSTVVFSTSGALSPRAVNDLNSTQQQPGPQDIYESHDAQVSLISTGHSLTPDETPVITPSGRDIFFASTEGILPQDSDGLKSLYDARIGGGFPAALVPAGGCNGDSCQGPPSVPSLLGASGSATFSGLGNPTPAVSKPAVNAKKAKSKPKRCRNGYVKRKGRCVRPKRKHKAAKSDRGAKS